MPWLPLLLLSVPTTLASYNSTLDKSPPFLGIWGTLPPEDAFVVYSE